MEKTHIAKTEKNKKLLKNSFLNHIFICFLLLSTSGVAQLTGIKTIDPSGIGANNYTTFSAAISALNTNGVGAGGVVFNVAAGAVFNESPLSINIGSNQPNSSNPVVFQNSGSGARPLINFTGTAATNDAALTLVGTDNITFDGLQVNDVGTSSSNWTEIGFYLVRNTSNDACQDIIIRNCTVSMNQTNAYSRGIYENDVNASGTVLEPTSVGGIFMDNTFYGDSIVNVSIGFVIAGSNTPGMYDENIDIGIEAGNNILLCNSAIQVRNSNNCSIANNTMAGSIRVGFGNTNVQGSLNIYNNTISFSNPVGASYAMFIIPIGGANDWVNIYNNVIENCNLGTAGGSGFYFWAIAAGTSTNTIIHDNIVRNIAQNSGGNVLPYPCAHIDLVNEAAFIPIFIYPGTNDNRNQAIYNNQIYNNSFAGEFAGIASYGSNSIIHDNTIQNNTLIKGSSQVVSGIFMPGGYNTGNSFNQSVYNNTISNLQDSPGCNGTNLSGIRYFTTSGIGGPTMVYNNQIGPISTNGSGNVIGIQYEMYPGAACVGSVALLSNAQVFKNQIFSLYSNGGTAKGISTNWIYGGLTMNINNNFIADIISTNGGNLSVAGISIGDSTNAKIYFNSISLKQTTGISAAFSSAGIYFENKLQDSVDFRNNLVVNNCTPGSSGKTVALWSSAASPYPNYNNSSDYNSYYAGAPGAQNLIFYDGTVAQQTLANFQAAIAPRETHALSSNTVFNSSIDLRTHDLTIANKGIYMAAYPTDIFGDVRLCVPDVGAYEFSINTSPGVTICSGASTTLTITGSTTYFWSPSSSLSSATASSVIASPLVSTTYTVIGSVGCPNQVAVFSVGVNPSPTVNVGTPQVICQGNSANLNATGGSSYIWNPSTYLSASTGANVTAMPTTYGVYGYTVTAISAAGCSSKGGMGGITVTVVSSLTANAGSDVTVCSGMNATLVGSGGSTYLWSPSNGISTTTGSTTVFSIAVPGHYSYTLTAGGGSGGCSASDGVVVSVIGAPTILTSPSLTICLGNSTVVSASGASVYLWSPSIGLSATTGHSIMAAPIVTTLYDITGTDANGCSTSSFVNVQVGITPLPVVWIAASRIGICSGGSTSLSALGTTSNGPLSFSWSPSSGLSSNTASTVSATLSAAAGYTVVGTDAGGCYSSAHIGINVSPLPTVLIFPGNNVSICQGLSTSLSATGATTYTWYPATALSASNTAVVSANPLASTSYTVMGTSSSCIGYANVLVSVLSLPGVSASANLTICKGNTATLSATGASVYTWSPATNPTSSGAMVNANPNTTTSYMVNGTDLNGCSNTAVVKVSVVSNAQTVSVSGNVTITQGNTTLLDVTAITGDSYTWMPSASLSCNSCSKPLASPSATTTYIVIQTDDNGCSSKDSIVVEVMPLCSSIFVPNAFSPNTDGKNDWLFIYGTECIDLNSFSFQIFDRWGNIVFSSTDPTKGWDGKHNGTELDPAVFVYSIQATLTNGNSVNKKGNISLMK